MQMCCKWSQTGWAWRWTDISVGTMWRSDLSGTIRSGSEQLSVPPCWALMNHGLSKHKSERSRSGFHLQMSVLWVRGKPSLLRSKLSQNSYFLWNWLLLMFYVCHDSLPEQGYKTQQWAERCFLQHLSGEQWFILGISPCLMHCLTLSS